MEMYREIACQNCSKQDGTVCGAHSNQSKHGKGRGKKASDEFCASLCDICHGWFDFGIASRQEKIDMWEMAHLKTTIALTKKFGKQYLEIIQ